VVALLLVLFELKLLLCDEVGGRAGPYWGNTDALRAKDLRPTSGLTAYDGLRRSRSSLLEVGGADIGGETDDPTKARRACCRRDLREDSNKDYETWIYTVIILLKES